VVGFKPWVLVAADDDAGGVAVEEEGACGGWEGCEEVVLEGEVEVRVVRVRNVDLCLEL